MLEKLKCLLILLVIGGTIPLYAQQDSNEVCLTNRQFDFYAQSLVERNGLREDTTLCWNQVRLYSEIIDNMDIQLGNFNDIIINKDIVIDIRNKDFAKLSIDYGKQVKKTKRWQQTALTFMGVSLALIIVVLIK